MIWISKNRKERRNSGLCRDKGILGIIRTQQVKTSVVNRQPRFTDLRRGGAHAVSERGAKQLNTTRKKSQRKSLLFLAIAIAFSIALLLGIAYVVLTNSAREQAYRTAAVLADQVESILKSNDQKEASLTASLKENYISKAKAVAYILDKNPEIELNIAEQIRIAKLMSIDEIHIFDESGTIYAGTVPVYYGYSFDSGEQMAFFKPMLENKALSMCQDVTPNTAEGKSMMYAICWNDFGTKMIQIGIEPVRLLEELRTNQISQVIADFPAYEGIEIIVADSGTCEVVGSTEPKEIGRSLKELGISTEEVDQYHQAEFSAVVNRVPCYCILSQADEYLITVAQKKADVHRDIPVVLMTMFLYLLLAAGVICFVVWKTARMIINEQKNANTDQLTGLLNRRAYEIDMKALERDPRRENLTCIVFDLNGLKAANDQMGHEAGDELLVSASRYLLECFGTYGSIYRTGGDEFVASLFLNDDQLSRAEEEFTARLEAWSRMHGRELSLSWGCASFHKNPELTLDELAKLAEHRMYEAKANYYKSKGIDRRR